MSGLTTGNCTKTHVGILKETLHAASGHAGAAHRTISVADTVFGAEAITGCLGGTKACQVFGTTTLSDGLIAIALGLVRVGTDWGWWYA